MTTRRVRPRLLATALVSRSRLGLLRAALLPALVLLSAWIVANLSGCSRGPTDPDDPIRIPPRPLTAAETLLVACDNTFAFDIFRECAAREPTGSNLAVSPLSIAMALTMALNGAEGETREAMEQALALTGLEPQEINEAYRGLLDLLEELDPDAILEIANSIWTRQGFPAKETFLEVNRVYFDARVDSLDFEDPASVDVINAWVAAQTRGMIPSLLDWIPSDAVMYLINAVYFKALWTYPFDPRDTETTPFHRADATDVPCDMMCISEIDPDQLYVEDRQAGVEVLELPYGVGDFCMTLVLPFPDHDLDALIAGLTQESWNAWLAEMQPVAHDFRLPRFEIEYKSELNEALAALGMGVAFTPLADFHGISARDLMISRVIHQAVVKVDETGTEAAAATLVEIVDTAAPPSFVADRPFLFVIRDRHSGAILFMGKVADPTRT